MNPCQNSAVGIVQLIDENVPVNCLSPCPSLPSSLFQKESEGATAQKPGPFVGIKNEWSSRSLGSLVVPGCDGHNRINDRRGERQRLGSRS